MTPSEENRALEGIRILSTRPQHQYQKLAEKLAIYGAKSDSHPAISIGAAPDPEKVRNYLNRLDDFEAVVFLSRNAATAFAKSETSFSRSKSSLPNVGAIGSGTKKALESCGYHVHFLPDHASSDSMADRIIGRYHDCEKPLLIVRADRGSEVLGNRLTAANIPFDELAIYTNVDVLSAREETLIEMSKGKYDWTTITSSAIAQNVASLFGIHAGKTKFVSISPQTSHAAREAGLTIAAEAESYDIDGLVDAVLKFEKN